MSVWLKLAIVGTLSAATDPHTELKAARTALEQGAAQQAIRLATQSFAASSLDADREAALLVRAVAEGAIGKTDDAKADLDKAVALKPDDWNAFADRADARGKAGDF